MGEAQGFWKNWHASYNLWLVRYLYVPLGGARRRALAIWPIFTFVAAWHDLEWRLLAWAWLSCLLFAPELVPHPSPVLGSYWPRHHVDAANEIARLAGA